MSKQILLPQETLDQYCNLVKAGLLNDPATLYAIEVGEGTIVAGPWVRLACSRHLNDLRRSDLQWDLAAAMHAIEFFPEMLVFTDGDKVGEPFHLVLWEKFIVGCLFGWKGMDGWRRFRTAYVEIGKGNGKSPLAGGIGLYLMVADGEASAEIYAAATKLDQAKILWNDAKKMVLASPIMSELVEAKTNILEFPDTFSFFKPISSEKRGLDGPRVHGGLIDELHEHADATVADKLRAGTKARNQALIFEITNSGFDKNTICYRHHEFTIRILRRLEFNDTWFGYVAALDQDDDPFEDERCWIKANPNLGHSIQLKYLREQVSEARGMPGKKSTVARLNFCQWVGAENPWIDEAEFTKITLSEEQINWKLLEQFDWYAGLDLSARRDLTALAVVWKLPEGLLAKIWYFTPEIGLEERAKKDKAPYDLWVEQGHIIATPGSTVDYGFVAKKIGELQAVNANLKGVAFDPWRIDLFKTEMAELGLEFELVKHGQGFQGGLSTETLWMPKSLEKTEEMILAKQLWLTENPVTTMCAANTIVRPDPSGNHKFDKERATGRIDGIVALAMAVGLAERAGEDGSSVYDRNDVKRV